VVVDPGVGVALRTLKTLRTAPHGWFPGLAGFSETGTTGVSIAGFTA
jgi:hypothetical protein